MNRYKTGLERKEKILEAARECFYAYGYRGTTMAKIAELAQMPQSLVAYYYKKDQLLMQIHEDFITNILRIIDQQVGDQLENTLQRHLLMQQLQFRGIYSDERSSAIHAYMVDNGLLSPRITEIVDTYLMESVREFSIEIDPDVYRAYIVAQYGAHRELVRVYLKEYDPVKSKSLFYFTGTIALRLARVSEEVMEENIRKVDRLLEQIDMSQIHFLA